MFCSANMPTATAGTSKENDDLTPVLVTSSAGGSDSPAWSMRSARIRTNRRMPPNSIAPSTTSKSGLPPSFVTKLIVLNGIVTMGTFVGSSVSSDT